MSEQKIITVKEARNGVFPSPLIYKHNPLVIIGPEKNVLWAGSREEFLKDQLIATGYYDTCELKAREHNLHLNDNTKIAAMTATPSTPEPWKVQKYLDRFWSRVEKRGEDECWEWQGCLTPQGYGNFHFGLTSVRAHRFSYQAQHGAITEHECVCHSCDNTICVNPKHLWLGTRTENNADKLAKGRNVPPPVRTGEHHHSAVLTTPEVISAKVMTRKGMPQARIAAFLGVSNALVCKIVNGELRAEETEQRVSACFNACQGIETVSLEADKPGWLQQACLSAYAERDAARSRIQSLEAALKRLLKWVKPIAGDNRNPEAEKEENESVEQASAALGHQEASCE